MLALLPHPPLTHFHPRGLTPGPPCHPKHPQDNFCYGISDTNLQNDTIVFSRSDASKQYPGPPGMRPFLTPQTHFSAFSPTMQRGVANQRYVPVRAIAQNEVMRTGKTAWTGLQLSVRPRRRQHRGRRTPAFAPFMSPSSLRRC